MSVRVTSLPSCVRLLSNDNPKIKRLSINQTIACRYQAPLRTGLAAGYRFIWRRLEAIKARNPLKSGLSGKKKAPQPRYALYQNCGSYLAPQVGLEPTTLRLTAECSAIELLRNIGSGSDLLSRAVSSQVPSAHKGLTSVFGMGTGGSPSPLPPEVLRTSELPLRTP